MMNWEDRLEYIQKFYPEYTNEILECRASSLLFKLDIIDDDSNLDKGEYEVKCAVCDYYHGL